MKKTILTEILTGFLITIIVFVLVIAEGIQPIMAQNFTPVIGIINQDITWTKANSPYNLEGNTLVANGVTLTIQPGVTVNLNTYYIQVNGTLIARGNNANPIYFSDGQITFTQSSTDWNESTGIGSIIENAVLNSTLTLNNSPKIHNDTVYSAINIQRTTGVPIISNNTIKGGISVAGNGMPIISNNTFLDQGISLFAANATVSGNTISGCSTGIIAYTQFWDDSHQDAWANSTSLIEGNLIVNNTIGVQVSEQQGSKLGSPIVRNNTVTKNAIGIYLTWIGLSGPNPTILNNNIYNNSNYNIKSTLSNDINATYNWWGTTNASLTGQKIYDFNYDFNLGTINFAPFLNESNPAAPKVPTFIISAAASPFFGGSISPSGYISVNYLDSQTFNITPNTGFHIVDVLVNGHYVGAVSSYTFKDVQAANTISAIFFFSPTPRPTPIPTPWQTPTPIIVSLSESASALNYGNTINFTVSADGGEPPYTYTWYVDGQLTVTSNSQYFSTDSLPVGSHHVYVQVNDADNNSAKTLTVEFNVLPVSSTSPSSNPSSSSSPTQQPTIEPSPTLDNIQAENYTPTIIMFGLVAVAVAAGALVYFKKHKK